MRFTQALATELGTAERVSRLMLRNREAVLGLPRVASPKNEFCLMLKRLFSAGFIHTACRHLVDAGKPSAYSPIATDLLHRNILLLRARSSHFASAVFTLFLVVNLVGKGLKFTRIGGASWI
jgi:hypothetical protein